MTESKASYDQTAEIKTTNIRLPFETWRNVKNILTDAGGKTKLNTLIIQLLDQYAEQNKSKKL